jgi:hypothetical protein
LELPPEGAYIRAKPITLSDASERLAQDANCSIDLARAGLQKFLIGAHRVETPHGRMAFSLQVASIH